MKRSLALFFAVCLLLCGCRADTPYVQPTATPTNPSTQPSPPPPTQPAPTDPEPTEPTEPTEPAYRHPITGEALDAPFTARCVAVVINNIQHAQPLYGIGQADILYEAMAEGGGSITRCVAVFSDVGAVEKIGSIRSARTYLIDVARVHNAIFVHCGGSPYAAEELAETGYDAINQKYNGKYFYRDQYRLDAGYAREHTLFTTGQDLLDCIAAKGYSMEQTYDPAFLPTFSEDATPDGVSGKQISVRFNTSGGKTTRMTYHSDDGFYYGEQQWGDRIEPFADETLGETVPFRNVFLLYVAISSPNGRHIFTQQTGEGDGYFACGGKIVPIKWHRASLDEPFTFTLTDGTPLVQGIGKTYVAILPIGSPTQFA